MIKKDNPHFTYVLLWFLSSFSVHTMLAITCGHSYPVEDEGEEGFGGQQLFGVCVCRGAVVLEVLGA